MKLDDIHDILNKEMTETGRHRDYIVLKSEDWYSIVTEMNFIYQ